MGIYIKSNPWADGHPQRDTIDLNYSDEKDVIYENVL